MSTKQPRVLLVYDIVCRKFKVFDRKIITQKKHACTKNICLIFTMIVCFVFADNPIVSIFPNVFSNPQNT